MRATITQTSLNTEILMHCHKDRVDTMDLLTLALSFIDANDRRQKYFGGTGVANCGALGNVPPLDFQL